MLESEVEPPQTQTQTQTQVNPIATRGKAKVRVTLSVDLLEAIVAFMDAPEDDQDYFNAVVVANLQDHQEEVNSVIGTALFKLGKGITKPTYTTQAKTLEQLVESGEATTEQITEYNRQLMELL